MTIIETIVFFVASAIFVDAYIITTRRWRSRESKKLRNERRLIPGIEGTGELTIGAKYAIWNYMFSILGIGGAVIGVIAGIAGYMINDLAKEKAIQVALTEMQKPLADRLAEFADAKSALAAATKTVLTDDFQKIVSGEVTRRLSESEEFRNNFANRLTDNSAFKVNVADVLAVQHADQLRGSVGAVGPAGKDGQNGASPSAATVAEALNDDGPFLARIADTLAIRHAGQLRGPVGAVGPAGKDGQNGVSPSSSAVAELLNSDGAFLARLSEALATQHASQLRGTSGAAGPAGRDGQNGASPTSSAVADLLTKDGAFLARLAEALADQHTNQLRGPAGAPGLAGKDGTNGTGPKLEDIAFFFLNNYADRLRGQPGVPGVNGKDGLSPSSEEVAKTLIAKHSEEIRQFLAVKAPSRISPRRSRPRKRR